jgi:hypothetical protein
VKKIAKGREKESSVTNAFFKESLQHAIDSFEAIRGIRGREFGAPNSDYKGVSDGNQGVQWNIRCEKLSEKAELGINLEGMKYENWPIAVALQNSVKGAGFGR